MGRYATSVTLRQLCSADGALCHRNLRVCRLDLREDLAVRVYFPEEAAPVSVFQVEDMGCRLCSGPAGSVVEHVPEGPDLEFVGAWYEDEVGIGGLAYANADIAATDEVYVDG